MMGDLMKLTRNDNLCLHLFITFTSFLGKNEQVSILAKTPSYQSGNRSSKPSGEPTRAFL